MARDEADEIVFDVSTPLGFTVRSTALYWSTIVNVKHPIMKGRMDDVISALRNPDQVRVSRSDSAVFLFYQKENASRWVCAIAIRSNGGGFLITTYPTDAIKEGKQVWPK